MILFFADTWHLWLRYMRATIRLPIWIAVTLIQPIIWLTLFGQLFRRVVELPGFETGTYIEFLSPGVIIMTAMFSGAWSGMGLIDELNHNVIDRMLATPLHRGAIITARILHASFTVVIQSLIILFLALLLGAGWPSVGGTVGVHRGPPRRRARGVRCRRPLPATRPTRSPPRAMAIPPAPPSPSPTAPGLPRAMSPTAATASRWSPRAGGWSGSRASPNIPAPMSR